MRISLDKLISAFLFLFPICLVMPFKISFGKHTNIHPIELLILFFIPILILIVCNEYLKPLSKAHFKTLVYISFFIIFIAASSFFTSLSKEGAIFIIRLIYLFIAFSLLLLIRPKLNMEAVTNGLLVSSVLLSVYIIMDNYILLNYVQRPGDIIIGGAVGLIPSIALGISLIKFIITRK